MAQQSHLEAPLVALVGFGLTLSPDAAMGALFGGMFFWALNPDMQTSTKLLLLIASLGAGYSLGLPLGPGRWEMAAAAFGAALVYVAIDSLRATIVSGASVPIWLKELLNLLPWRGGSK